MTDAMTVASEEPRLEISCEHKLAQDVKRLSPLAEAKGSPPSLPLPSALPKGRPDIS